MQKLKNFVKKYFKDFSFFYRYLRSKIFIAFLLSVSVGFLDGLGLTMFIPLLQVVSEGGIADSEEMGKLGIFIKGLESLGISMTLMGVLLLMIIFFSLKGAATYLRSIYLIILQQSFIRKIRLNLLSMLNQIEFKRFITSDVGRIQNTMTGEVDRVQRAFTAYFNTMQQADRKSTRLNSSHVANSYAVFCLQIKNSI